MGAGILLTRLLGFVRERVFAHYFGDGPAADAFRAALRIPNVIRNLLGEGTLSASFIPVYARLIERGDTGEARGLAGTVASLLVLLTAAAALGGVVLAPAITGFVAPGFAGETRVLTIRLVEIMFPMSGILILSGWCLGILNTHRRYFLAYAAPALWNIAQIATLVALGGVLLDALRLVVALAWGALLGSVLQLVVQLPAALRLAGRVGWSLDVARSAVRDVARAWVPVIVGAGVYQISSIIDTQLASFLEPGAVAILGYAQLVAILPVSLFGVSVAAVALPELSRGVAAAGGGADAAALTRQFGHSARRLAFFVVPAAVGLALLRTPIIGGLFQTGAFGAAETAVAANVLAAYALAVPAQGSVKLLASGHYALGDTRTPMRIALLSVAVSAGSAFVLMQHLGPAGIALGAAAGAWVNSALNYRALRRKLGPLLRAVRRDLAVAALAVLPAALGAAAAVSVVGAARSWPATILGTLVFGLVYGVATLAARHPEAVNLWGRARRAVGFT